MLHSQSRPRALDRHPSKAALACLMSYVALSLGSGPGAQAASGGGVLTPAYLRCEARVDPLGIDEPAPRLSWLVKSGRRGQVQTAYHILVAGSKAALGRDQGDLWDTGKVSSPETTGVVYRGRPLASHQSCFWKVRVWDRDGNPSGWSRPAVWSMGLLGPSAWSGQWVGFDQEHGGEPPEAPLGAAKWIGFSGDDHPDKPNGPRVFRSTLTLPEGTEVARAELLVGYTGRISIAINGLTAAVTGPGFDPSKRAQREDVTPLLKAGENSLRAQVEGSGAVRPELIAQLVVVTRDGKTITHVTDASWRCTDEANADGRDRPLDSGEWPACRVVAEYGAPPRGTLQDTAPILPPPSYLRAPFRAEKPVRRAVLYATALGLVDVYLNGRRVTDDRFNPGWTDYTKRVYYRAYDVTGLVRPGANAWGAILADGWYSGHLGWWRIRDRYGKRPRLRAQLHLEYDDGTTADVATGPDWKASTGPIREADILMGETYDARKAIAGWDLPGFQDEGWKPVDVGAEFDPVIQAHPGPPVRAFAELKPEAITEPRPGLYVVDLGQNFAGVARLKVTGEPGQAITLRFAERLNPDGTPYTANLRGARATDTYICRGGDTETWQPRFTFHGFQYVEVRGLKSRPTEDTVTGVAISSDTPPRARSKAPIRCWTSSPGTSTGPNAPTSSTSRPTAPSATSGSAGRGMPRSTSAPRPSSPTSRRSSPSG